MKGRDDSLRRALAKTDIAEVIGRYTVLRESTLVMGPTRMDSWVGPCPFHEGAEEEEESLVVIPERQVFKCLACGAAGGLIAFLMQANGWSRAEAGAHLVAGTY